MDNVFVLIYFVECIKWGDKCIIYYGLCFVLKLINIFWSLKYLMGLFYILYEIK